MNKSLHIIQQKIKDIQLGLLQVRDKDDNKTSFQVRATMSEDDSSVDCVVTDKAVHQLLKDQSVNLVQKHKDDYLYITGKVSAEVNNGNKILSLHIVKASWFVKKMKGSVSFLQEKFVYENYERANLELAS